MSAVAWGIIIFDWFLSVLSEDWLYARLVVCITFNSLTDDRYSSSISSNWIPIFLQPSGEGSSLCPMCWQFMLITIITKGNTTSVCWDTVSCSGYDWSMRPLKYFLKENVASAFIEWLWWGLDLSPSYCWPLQLCCWHYYAKQQHWSPLPSWSRQTEKLDGKSVVVFIITFICTVGSKIPLW
jgi:hypothetical protein